MNKHLSEREKENNIDAPKVITPKFFYFFRKLPGIALDLTEIGKWKGFGLFYENSAN